MSISPHRILHDLYIGPKLLTDPGNAAIIRPSADLQICEMVSGASAESRTLANPTKPGIRFTLRLLTDGGGNVDVYAENGLNTQLETNAVFADAGDHLSLISVTKSAGVYRWEALVQAGASLASASATSTATATATGTTTSTPTSTPSATATSTRTSTQSISGSDTASGTFSASATSTGTSTGTSSGTPTTTRTSTSTKTSTATATATGTQ